MQVLFRKEIAGDALNLVRGAAVQSGDGDAAGNMTLVALGGVCYSVGAVFYAVKRPSISAEWTFHELFHLLILAGSLFHYAAIYFYVL